MSRDNTGTYTLPAGNPVVTDTTITTQWANSTLNDIATALTNSLSRNGRGGMNSPLEFANGSELAPSITFTEDTNTGFFLNSQGNMQVTVAGTTIMKWIDGGAFGNLIEINGTVAGTLDIGLPINRSVSYYDPRTTILNTDNTDPTTNVNLSLGQINPWINFTSDLNVDVEGVITANSGFIGLVTDPATENSWYSNLLEGEFVVGGNIVSIISGLGALNRTKTMEFGAASRTSINVFNKIDAETVTTRTNNAQLVVASPQQAQVVTTNTVHSILVTDNREVGTPTYGPGNGGSIAFASGTNLKEVPTAFGTIRGSINDNDFETAGALEVHVRNVVGPEGSPEDQSLVARFEGTSVECVAPLIIWDTYDPADLANNLRGIVSDSKQGFNYQELSRVNSQESFKAFGFTKNGTSLNAWVNNAGPYQIATTSDYRVKNEIGLLKNGVDKIKLMRPIEYTDKEGTQTNRVNQGFIAHEMQAIIPSVVSGEKDAVDKDGNIEPQSLYYAGLTPILIKAVQELTARIEALEA